jgi:hypothetical protein
MNSDCEYGGFCRMVNEEVVLSFMSLAFSLGPKTVRLSTISAGFLEAAPLIPSSWSRAMNALNTSGKINRSTTGTVTLRDSDGDVK